VGRRDAQELWPVIVLRDRGGFQIRGEGVEPLPLKCPKLYRTDLRIRLTVPRRRRSWFLSGCFYPTKLQFCEPESYYDGRKIFINGQAFAATLRQRLGFLLTWTMRALRKVTGDKAT
jgi:hypothetical protein